MNRFNLKNARPRKNAPKSPKRPRRSRGDGNSAMPYWIAAALVAVLIVLIAWFAEGPRIRAYLAGVSESSRYARESTEHQTAAEQQRSDRLMRDLQKKVAVEKKQLAVREAAAKAKALAAQKKADTLAAQKAAEAAAAAAVKAQPPGTKPAPVIAKIPARALPLDPNVLTTERIAAYQVALERAHFSCGFIDGDQGMRTQRMLRAYQAGHGLPVTGFLTPETRNSIGEPGEPFLNYVVTEADVASIMPKPATWREKSKATRLGYNNIWEMLAEKFHCTRGYLKQLNPGVKEPVAGTEMIGPKVFPAAPYPHVASLRVLLGETSIEALDASGRVVAFFPCSIAADKNKRPNGELRVKSVVPNPDYTFDPALFKDAAAREGLTHKMTIPPGPRNPVGNDWIGLSLPGYGIHGTPDPEAISRTQSHGCFRLANWNADKVLRMVHVGTPVDVQP